MYQNLLDSAPPADLSVDAAFALLNKFTGKSYSQFEYVGGKNAKTVFVAYGTHINEQWKNLINEDIGLVQVRVPLPFNQDNFYRPSLIQPKSWWC